MSYNKILTADLNRISNTSDEDLLESYKFACTLLEDTRTKLANKQYRSRKGCMAAIEHELACKHILLGVIAVRGLMDKVPATLTGWDF